jgi:S-adenosyl methyltransferase
VTQSNSLPFDTSLPNPARMWNYWVGGKDHFAADRQAAEQIMATMPQLPVIARMVRRFLINAVHELTSEHGIRQFLDIGTGLPTADNTTTWRSGWRPRPGSSTWTSTRWCSATPGRC